MDDYPTALGSLALLLVIVRPAACVTYESCSEPPPVFNAYRHVTSFDVGSNVTYSCYQSFKLGFGSLTRVCEKTGNYSGNAPVCQAACVAPIVPCSKINASPPVAQWLSLAAVCEEGSQWASGLEPPVTLSCDQPTRLWLWPPSLTAVSDICERELALDNSSLVDPPDPTLDVSNVTCVALPSALTHDWTTNVTSLSYVTRLLLQISFQWGAAGSYQLTAAVLTNTTSAACVEYRGLVGAYGQTLLQSLSLACRRSSGGQYPFGHTLQLTFNHSEARTLSICTVKARGCPKTEFCPWPPEMAGIVLRTPRSAQVMYTSDTFIRYDCDGDRVPLTGEDLARCDVTSGSWTKPTLQCTDKPDFGVSQAVLSSTSLPLVIDGDDHTCTTTSLSFITSKSMTVGVKLTNVIEVERVRIVIPALFTSKGRQSSSEPETQSVVEAFIDLLTTLALLSATVVVPLPNARLQNCTTFSRHGTSNRTVIIVWCDQRPVTQSFNVTFNVNFNLFLNWYFSLCEISVFGRRFSGTAVECSRSPSALDYKGKQSTTVGGLTCLRWDSVTDLPFTEPDRFPDRSLYDAANYCRNPHGSNRLSAWCYVTKDSFDLCLVPICDSMCRVDTKGVNYIGFNSMTSDGHTCQKWNSPELLALRRADFPDGSVDHNYCRNPDSLQSTPWCFASVSDVITSRPCAIPECPMAARVLDESSVDSQSDQLACFLQSKTGFVLSQISWRDVTESGYRDSVCLNGAGAVQCHNVSDGSLVTVLLVCPPMDTTTSAFNLSTTSVANLVTNSDDAFRPSANWGISATTTNSSSPQTGQDSASTTPSLTALTATSRVSTANAAELIGTTTMGSDSSTTAVTAAASSSRVAQVVTLSTADSLAATTTQAQNRSLTSLSATAGLTTSSSTAGTSSASSLSTTALKANAESQATAPTAVVTAHTNSTFATATTNVARVNASSSGVPNFGVLSFKGQACLCRQQNTTSLPARWLSQGQLAELRRELTVAKGNTSSSIRKKISATDGRPSSAGIGVVGCLFLAALVGLFLVGDFISAATFLWEVCCIIAGRIKS